MPQKNRIIAQEWRWAIAWSIAILILSCLPYLIASRMAPEGWRFAGIMVNPYDGHSYMAKMQQGAEGNWLFHLAYTPEAHDGTFIFTFYLGLGHLAALTGLPLIWIFHLTRLAAGFGLLLIAFRFIAQMTPHSNERRLAFIFLLSASGFGWLGAIFGAFPIDLWVPEAFTPYSLYANPHFPLAMALMLIIFQLVAWPKTPNEQISQRPTVQSLPSNEVKGPKSNNPKSKTCPERSRRVQNPKSNNPKSKIQNPKSIVCPGLAALALALVLPFALLTVWAVLAVYLSWLYVVQRRLPWPQIWSTLGVGLFSAPVIGYDYWVSATNPILIGWAAQNITAAPPFLDFALGYGLLGLLALVGAWLIVRNNRDSPKEDQGLLSKQGEWLVLWWAITTVVLVYLPFDLQRRLINGLHIPVCILAAIGLARWLDNSRLKSGYRSLISNAVITLGVLGTLFVWGVPLLGMLQPPTESEITGLFFLRQEEIIALTWLRKNSTPDDVVLTSPRLGTFVPGQTGARAFYGHPFETIDTEAKKAMAEAFYRGEIENVSPPVDFIIYGPSEQDLGRPERLSDYPLVFTANGISIYKTTQ